MQRTLVEGEKRWTGHRRFLHALNCCVLLPGHRALAIVSVEHTPHAGRARSLA